MFKSNFKVALRNLFRNKLSSFLNIGGLAVGMGVAILISIWIYDELSFNRSHKNYENIAQLKVHADYDGEIFTIDSHPMPLAEAIRNNYSADFKLVIKATAKELHVFKIDEQSIPGSGIFMEPGGAEMLSLKTIDGRIESISDEKSLLISETLANNIFGKQRAVGKLISLDNKVPMRVGGVYENIPENDEFKGMDFVAPFDIYLQENDWARAAQNNWSGQSVKIYAQLNQKNEMESVNRKIRDIKLKNISGEQAKRKPVVFLQPMSEWHLKSTFKNGKQVTSEGMKYIWFYGIIGLFVLLLACINFMNLSTAKSEKRSKEVGIRKAIGSRRIQLIRQFFGESILVAVLGFMFSLIIVQLTLPWFNQVAGKNMSLPLLQPMFWLCSVLFIAFTGALAGVYPALYLSSFRPVKVLKSMTRAGYKASLPRKILVVVQFTVSIALIVATIVVYRQIQYARDRAIGYSQENLVSIHAGSAEYQGRFNVIKSELEKSGVIKSVATAASPVTSVWSTSTNMSWKGKDPAAQIEFATLGISQDYGKTVGWQFQAGRDFEKEMSTDSSALILNETAVKKMGLKNPVGEIIQRDGKNYSVVGVVKDMVMESPFKPTYPTVFFLSSDMNFMLAKLNSGTRMQDAINTMEATLKTLAPGTAPDVQFVDEAYAAKFAAEKRVGNLSTFFSMLAIFISCLGIFGLASFVAERRIKEIGVRKVLGASVVNLWILLSKEFVTLVALSFLIATPIAYLLMNQWLQNYEYRTSLNWWIFGIAGGGALLITIITASYQGVKAAMMNPVRALRSE